MGLDSAAARQVLVERTNRLLEARQRCLGHPGADLSAPVPGVEDARVDGRRLLELHDASGVDTDRRTSELEVRQLEPATAPHTHLVERLGGLHGPPPGAA